MRSYKTRGVVLHTMSYGETSLIAFMLTDTLGRQNYLVQGARKGHRNALFQPMFVLDIEAATSPRLQMHRVREVVNAMPLNSTPFDIRKSTIALFMAEVLYRLVKETGPQSPLFDFVTHSIQTLDSLTDGVANFHLWFLVHLSFHLGFYPGNEPVPNAFLDIREGLFTPYRPMHDFVLSRENTAILTSLMSTPDLAQIKLTRTVRSQFLTEILRYFAYHLDTTHQIKSVEILKEVF